MNIENFNSKTEKLVEQYYQAKRDLEAAKKLLGRTNWGGKFEARIQYGTDQHGNGNPITEMLTIVDHSFLVERLHREIERRFAKVNSLGTELRLLGISLECDGK